MFHQDDVHGRYYMQVHNPNTQSTVSSLADPNGGGLRQGAEIVGLLHAFLGVPLEVELVGQNTRSEGRTIVAAPANQHDARARDLLVRLELVLVAAREDFQG